MVQALTDQDGYPELLKFGIYQLEQPTLLWPVKKLGSADYDLNTYCNGGMKKLVFCCFPKIKFKYFLSIQTKAVPVLEISIQGCFLIKLVEWVAVHKQNQKTA